MSLPIITLTCTGCGLRQTTGMGGNREYILDDGRRLQIHERSGWCHGCGGVRSIEVLDAQTWIGEIAEIRDELASVRTTTRWLRSRLEYDGLFFGHGERARVVALTAHEWSRRLNDALVGLELLARRQSAPRCLACGSPHVEPPSESEGRPMHPGCGGTFDAEITGDIMIRGRRNVHRYTSEGELLGTIRADFET